MKTILVVYTNKLLPEDEVIKLKRYSFNTGGDVKEGDLLSSPNYETSMQVVKVFDKHYEFYNSHTGELSNEFNSSRQWTIRTLALFETQSNVVYASKVYRDK